jgi:hypothetical protein
MVSLTNTVEFAVLCVVRVYAIRNVKRVSTRQKWPSVHLCAHEEPISGSDRGFSRLSPFLAGMRIFACSGSKAFLRAAGGIGVPPLLTQRPQSRLFAVSAASNHYFWSFAPCVRAFASRLDRSCEMRATSHVTGAQQR